MLAENWGLLSESKTGFGLIHNEQGHYRLALAVATE